MAPPPPPTTRCRGGRRRRAERQQQPPPPRPAPPHCVTVTLAALHLDAEHCPPMRDRTDKALPPPSSPWIQLLFPVDLRQQETRGHLRRCWWREGRQMGTTSGSCSRMVSSSKRSLRSFTLGLCKRGHMRQSRRATIVAMVCSCNFNWHNGLDYQPMALYCLCRRGSLGLPLTLPLLQRPPSVALAALCAYKLDIFDESRPN